MEAATEKLGKKRATMSAAILLLAVAAVVLDRYCAIPIMSFLSGIKPEQIGDKGVEPMEMVFIAYYKLCFGVPFCALMATFLEKKLRPDAFGTFSRWGCCFALCLFCFSQLAGR